MNRAAVRSPVGGRGKTIKEYELELADLRRDNFDLRMRIYLMEEYNGTAGHDESSTDYHPPSTFATMKDLYLTNKNLKVEVEEFKEKLAQKEAAAELLAVELETLKKDTSEQMDKLEEVHRLETKELNERIAHLTNELTRLEDVMTAWRMDPRELSTFNDTATMAAAAFNVLRTPGHIRKQSEQTASYNDMLAFECQIAMLEKELQEERQLRVESDLAVDSARSDLQEAESARRTLTVVQARAEEKAKALQEQLAAQEIELEKARAAAAEAKTERLRLSDDETSKSLKEQLVMREQELATAHKIIEEKCLAVDSLEDILNRLRLPPSRKGGDYSHSGEGLSDLEKQVAALSSKLSNRESEVESLRRENVKALRTIQGFIKQNKALARDLEEMRQRMGVPDEKTDSGEKNSSKEELEKKVEMLNEELDCLKKCLGDDEKSSRDAAGLIMSLRADLDVKRKEVDLLNEELRKRTFNLQELVNHELWDKNREIEKLNKICERKQLEVGNLKKEVYGMTEKLKAVNQEGKENKNPNINNKTVEKNREELNAFEEDNRKLRVELEMLRDRFKEQVEKCDVLKKDVEKFRSEAEESEKSRKELVNACTLLTTRLEELATFLESLLPSLGSRKRRMVQQAIDRSREMSRSFSFLDRSNLSVPILPDVSQVEFCSGDESLRLDLKEPEDGVVRLRTQVESIVEKLKLAEGNSTDKPATWLFSGEQLEDVSQCSLVDSLDSESQEEAKSRPSVAIVTCPAEVLVPSDSDGEWSEPDLNVSKQRIGIMDTIKTIDRQIVMTNSTDESNRSFRKSPSVSKKRTDGMSELRRLSAKLDNLEQVNEALQAEVLKLHKAPGPLSPRALLEKVRSQKRATSDNSNEIQLFKEFESRLVQEVEQLSSQLERSCRLCLELEERATLFEVDKDKAAAQALELSEQVSTLEERLASAEIERDEALTQVGNLSSRLEEAKEALQSAAKEHENALLESQCSLLEANNKTLLLRAKVDSLSDAVTDKQKVIEQLEGELLKAKQEVQEAENRAVELKTSSDHRSLELAALKEKEEDVMKRNVELERRLAEAYEEHADLRAKINEEQSHYRAVEDHYKVEDRGLRRLLAESESRRAELRHQLDAAVLTTSEAVLQRTRLADDKMRLQRDLRTADTAHYSVVKEYKRRIADLEAEVRDLESGRGGIRMDPVGCARSPPIMLRSPPISPRSRPISPRSPPIRSPPVSPRSLPASPPPGILLARQRSNPSSDYVSDQEHYYHHSGMWSLARSNNNSSPDLGIESDQHSLSQRHPALDPLPQLSHPPPNGDVGKLETENYELRRHLLKTRKALEDTLSQLTCANQKKKQVERAICKQLHKTHHILQKARVNLESDPS